MPKQEITVTIGPDGDITVSTSGFKGSGCLKATANLEKILGKKTSDQPTKEMSQQSGQQQNAKAS